MTFEEWKDKYGIESARKQFRMTDHLVFVVRKGNVMGICGDWKASEPLGFNPNVEQAKQRIRNAIAGVFSSEETLFGCVAIHPVGGVQGDILGIDKENWALIEWPNGQRSKMQFKQVAAAVPA